MLKWGINNQNHNASLCVFDTDKKEILFASENERFSKIKNDTSIGKDLIDYAFQFGVPENIIIAENPISKKYREIKSGQWKKVFEISPKKQFESIISCFDTGDFYYNIEYCSHHLAHARQGFFTSEFKDATILVVDAIGDDECISIWKGIDNKLTCLHKTYYPNSLGLLYSAITKALGKKPNEEEYIVMGMSSFENSLYYEGLEDFIIDKNIESFKVRNLHKGFSEEEISRFNENPFRTANAIQILYEDYLEKFCIFAKSLNNSKNLILTGGCALNCVANTKILSSRLFNNVYIPFNCGDGGLSMGAVLTQHINKPAPYLGYNLESNVDKIPEMVSKLERGEIIGLAQGKSEFGPRALGNRSLLADPRKIGIKNEVNNIKQREEFRPFAVSILESYAKKYFFCEREERVFSPNMQYVFKTRDPKKYSEITHVDGTCRIQTVNEKQNYFYYQLLSEWNSRTGCPMLLNTSLNIKGQPIINNEEDCKQFSEKYNIRIY